MKKLSRFERIRYVPLVQAVLDQAGAVVPPEQWEVHANGSAHMVVNAGHQVSVRIAKTPGAGAKVQRRTDLLRALPADLPFRTPQPLTRVLTKQGMTAVGLTWLPGHPREPGSASPRMIGRAMRAINAIDPGDLAPYTDPTYAFWGADHWVSTLRQRVVPLLLRDNQQRALRLVQEAAALDPVEARIIHADFSGHNMLWTRERLTGVIDWDHACIGDPAWDIASAANWYGWETMRRCMGREWTERARVLYRLLPLQSVGYAVVNEVGGGIRREAVERADHWLARNC